MDGRRYLKGWVGLHPLDGVLGGREAYGGNLQVFKSHPLNHEHFKHQRNIVGTGPIVTAGVIYFVNHTFLNQNFSGAQNGLTAKI